MPHPVLILHGLWMRAPALQLLRRRLHAEGFAPATFDYASRSADPVESCRRLARRIESFDGEAVHLVGHSLGGLLALETLAQYARLPVGRIVCLGSPLRGASAASGLGRFSASQWFLGRSADLLRRGAVVPAAGASIGMIAGTRPFGFGRFFTRFDGPNDGTVALRETRVEGLADHIAIHATHSGLIFSRQAAALTARFLRNGSFG